MIDDLNAIHPLLPPVAGALVLLIAAVIADLVAKRIIVSTVQTVARRSSVTWDDALIEHNVIGRLVQILPGLIVFTGVQFVPGLPEALVQLTRNVATGYMVLVSTMALTALLCDLPSRAT
jgi:miniconductance mechanosensitive channel